METMCFGSRIVEKLGGIVFVFENIWKPFVLEGPIVEKLDSSALMFENIRKSWFLESRIVETLKIDYIVFYLEPYDNHLFLEVE